MCVCLQAGRELRMEMCVYHSREASKQLGLHMRHQHVGISEQSPAGQTVHHCVLAEDKRWPWTVRTSAAEAKGRSLSAEVASASATVGSPPPNLPKSYCVKVGAADPGPVVTLMGSFVGRPAIVNLLHSPQTKDAFHL